MSLMMVFDTEQPPNNFPQLTEVATACGVIMMKRHKIAEELVPDWERFPLVIDSKFSPHVASFREQCRIEYPQSYTHIYIYIYWLHFFLPKIRLYHSSFWQWMIWFDNFNCKLLKDWNYISQLHFLSNNPSKNSKKKSRNLFLKKKKATSNKYFTHTWFATREINVFWNGITNVVNICSYIWK